MPGPLDTFRLRPDPGSGWVALGPADFRHPEFDDSLEDLASGRLGDPPCLASWPARRPSWRLDGLLVAHRSAQDGKTGVLTAS